MTDLIIRFQNSYYKGLRSFMEDVEAYNPKEQDASTFYSLLNYATSKFGVTEQRLSREMGIPRSTLNTWKNGWRVPSLQQEEEVKKTVIKLLAEQLPS